MTAQHRAATTAPQHNLEIWGTIAAVAGVVMIAAGYLLGSVTNSGMRLSQWNGLCASGVGQFAQALSTRAATGCGEAATLEQLHGWLIVLGALLVIAGAAAGIYTANHRPAPAAWPQTPGGQA